MKNLPRYRRCFVCGRDNDAGLNVMFHRSGSTVTADFSGDTRHVGFPHQIHGGILSSLLDESMLWSAVSSAAAMVQTWEINVRFHRPLPPGKPVHVEAWVEKDKAKYVLAMGRIFDDQGNIYARGTGKYFRISDAQEKEILRELYVEGEEGRPVTPEDY